MISSIEGLYDRSSQATFVFKQSPYEWIIVAFAVVESQESENQGWKKGKGKEGRRLA